MTWVNLGSAFAYGSKLTSTQMQNLRDNIAAAFAKDSGAPELASGYVEESMLADGYIFKLLDNVDVSSPQATVDFESYIDSTYHEYQLHFQNVIPSTDNKDLYFLTDSDGGASYDNTSGDYQWAYRGLMSDGTDIDDARMDVVSGLPAGDSSFFPLSVNGVGNGGIEHGVSGVLHLIKPAATTYTHIYAYGMYADFDNEIVSFSVAGQRKQAADVDAVRFIFEAGNIESGNFQLFGLKKS